MEVRRASSSPWQRPCWPAGRPRPRRWPSAGPARSNAAPCRARCAITGPNIQACLIRCNATQEYNRAAGAERPQQGLPAPRTRSRQPVQAEARRSAPPPASLDAGAASRGPASGPAGPEPGTSPQPAPDSRAAARGRATQVAAAAAGGAATTAAPGARSWGAASAAAPATGFGLTAGLADRLAAHAQAQAACGAAGASCRAALDFADRCGAVAQARRTLGLFTADPRTFPSATPPPAAGRRGRPPRTRRWTSAGRGSAPRAARWWRVPAAGPEPPGSGRWVFARLEQRLHRGGGGRNRRRRLRRAG